MSCRQIIEFLEKYISGELSALEKLKFEAHLALCRDCRQYLSSYKQTILLAKSIGGEPLDEACRSIPEDLVIAILKARSPATEPEA